MHVIPPSYLHILHYLSKKENTAGGVEHLKIKMAETDGFENLDSETLLC